MKRLVCAYAWIIYTLLTLHLLAFSLHSNCISSKKYVCIYFRGVPGAHLLKFGPHIASRLNLYRSQGPLLHVIPSLLPCLSLLRSHSYYHIMPIWKCQNKILNFTHISVMKMEYGGNFPTLNHLNYIPEMSALQTGLKQHNKNKVKLFASLCFMHSRMSYDKELIINGLSSYWVRHKYIDIIIKKYRLKRHLNSCLIQYYTIQHWFPIRGSAIAKGYVEIIIEELNPTSRKTGTYWVSCTALLQP